MFSSLPNEYENQIEELKDEYLIELAMKSLEKYNQSNSLSQEEVYKRLDIREEDIKDFEQIEIG